MPSVTPVRRRERGSRPPRRFRIGGIESPRSQGSAIGIDDEQAFPVHVVIAVDQTLQWAVRHGGSVGQCSELSVPFGREFSGSAVRQTERQRDCECRHRQKQQDDEDGTNSQAHVRRPAENRTRAPSEAEAR